MTASVSPLGADDEFTCAICHELLHRPARLPCNHAFCSRCLRDWGRRSNSCALCRAGFARGAEWVVDEDLARVGGEPTVHNTTPSPRFSTPFSAPVSTSYPNHSQKIAEAFPEEAARRAATAAAAAAAEPKPPPVWERMLKDAREAWEQVPMVVRRTDTYVV